MAACLRTAAAGWVACAGNPASASGAARSPRARWPCPPNCYTALLPTAPRQASQRESMQRGMLRALDREGAAGLKDGLTAVLPKGACAGGCQRRLARTHSRLGARLSTRLARMRSRLRVPGRAYHSAHTAEARRETRGERARRRRAKRHADGPRNLLVVSRRSAMKWTLKEGRRGRPAACSAGHCRQRGARRRGSAAPALQPGPAPAPRAHMTLQQPPSAAGASRGSSLSTASSAAMTSVNSGRES